MEGYRERERERKGTKQKKRNRYKILEKKSKKKSSKEWKTINRYDSISLQPNAKVNGKNLEVYRPPKA